MSDSNRRLFLQQVGVAGVTLAAAKAVLAG
jgi:hypothetical protein